MQDIRRRDGRYAYNAGANLVPGQLIVRPCGTPAIFDGLEAAVSGQLIEPQPMVPALIVEFDAASATTFAAGDIVYVNSGTQLATATNTDIRVGKACRAKTSGQLKVLVNCGA
jgi:hypothetical protein